VSDKNKISKEDIQKAIRQAPGLCGHWMSGYCHFPNGWKNDKRLEETLPKCIIKPGINEIICLKCEIDNNLIDFFLKS